jgi:hypothetical protein
MVQRTGHEPNEDRPSKSNDAARWEEEERDQGAPVKSEDDGQRGRHRGQPEEIKEEPGGPPAWAR